MSSTHFIPANSRPRQRTTPSSTAKRGRKPRSGTLDSPLAPSPDLLSIPSATPSAAASPATTAPIQWTQPVATTPVAPVAAPAPITAAADVHIAGPSLVTSALPGQQRPIGAMEEEVEAEDELLPAMADDDYSAQLSWQSQSKDNLKCVPFFSFHFLLGPLRSLDLTLSRVLMDNFTPEQYERFEAYRRHALPKQAVRKVWTQLLVQSLNAHIRTRRLGR